jgi:hypothetical protein
MQSSITKSVAIRQRRTITAHEVDHAVGKISQTDESPNVTLQDLTNMWDRSCASTVQYRNSFRPGGLIMMTTSLKPFCKEGRQCTCNNAVSVIALAPQFPLTGNATLLESLAFVKLSRASAYEFGIVPMFDDDGFLVETDKTPPHPWTRMPLPITVRGKKLFDAAEIRDWRDAMRDRSRPATRSSPSGDQAQREVTA